MENQLVYCTVEATLKVLGGKWKVLIIYHLTEQPHRYNQLKKKIPNISQKVLTDQLKQLEKDGLIFRKDYHQKPPRVEYGLTPYGKSVKPIMASMCKWGSNHIQKNGWELKTPNPS